MSKETNSTAQEQDVFEKTILLAQREKEKVVLCEVCGHANTEKDALCKMCSNYLKGVR